LIALRQARLTQPERQKQDKPAKPEQQQQAKGQQDHQQQQRDNSKQQRQENSTPVCAEPHDAQFSYGFGYHAAPKNAVRMIPNQG